jgi:hypothetical protein
MSIKNPDGTPYQVLGSLSQFNVTSNDNKLLCRWNSELSNIGGATIFYYRLYMGTTKIDNLYVECRSKIYNQVPVQMKAVYEIATSGFQMNMFGLDGSLDSTTFMFNYNDFLQSMNQRQPYAGDLIYTTFRKQWFEVQNMSITGFQRYNQVQLQVFATKLQENLTDLFNLNSFPQSDLPSGPVC